MLVLLAHMGVRGTAHLRSGCLVSGVHILAPAFAPLCARRAGLVAVPHCSAVSVYAILCRRGNATWKDCQFVEWGPSAGFSRSFKWDKAGHIYLRFAAAGLWCMLKSSAR